MVAGNFFNGWLLKYYTTKTIVAGLENVTHNWGPIWQITVLSSVVLMIAMGVLFRYKAAKAPATRV
jgi:hypothetical protein